MNSKIFYTREHTRTYYNFRDNNKPVTLVFNDGLACDGFAYNLIVDDFMPYYNILSWNYPGHGNAEIPLDKDNISVESYASNLADLLEYLELEKVIFLGHSLGVQVMLNYLLSGYGPKPLACCYLCGAPGSIAQSLGNTDFFAKILPAIRMIGKLKPLPLRLFWQKVLPSELSVKVALISGQVNPDHIDMDLLREYLRHVSRVDLDVFTRLIESAEAMKTAEEDLKEIDIPGLVIAAENDTLTPLSRSIEIEEWLPNSELRVLPNATHAAPAEFPGLIRDIIIDYLRRESLFEAETT